MARVSVCGLPCPGCGKHIWPNHLMCAPCSPPAVSRSPTGFPLDAIPPASIRRWLLRCARQRNLRRLQATLQDLRPRIWMAVALRRWQAAVWAAQADDASLCHRAVQLPRAFAAWRHQAQVQVQLRRMGDECRQALVRRRRHALLAAWQRWADGKQAARAAQQRAAAHFATHTALAVLAAWRLAVAAKAARREQQVQAAAHWDQWRIRAVFARWRRWAALRRRAPEARTLYLLSHTFGAWRQEAARKSAKAARLRLAVRQHYLRQIWAGWAAWQQHHRRQQQKRQRLDAMRQYCGAVLVRHCLAAWRGPCLAAARSKRASVQLAGRHAAGRLLRLALAAWRGPFMAQARQQQALQRRADKFRAAILLQRAVTAWCLCCMRRAEKRQRLGAACALLRPGRLRRLLVAWRRVCAIRTRLRWQVRQRQTHCLCCTAECGKGMCSLHVAS